MRIPPSFAKKASDLLTKIKAKLMPQKISEQLAAIERHWAGAKEYLTKNPAKVPEQCRTIFKAEQKLLKQVIEEKLVNEFSRAVACFKGRNTVEKVINAVKTEAKPWSACPPQKPAKPVEKKDTLPPTTPKKK